MGAAAACRKNASPRGEARPRAVAAATRRGRDQDPLRLAQAADVEPCDCPLVPIEGTLHDLQGRLEKEGQPDGIPLAAGYRLAAWVLGLDCCYHSYPVRRMLAVRGEAEWVRRVAVWAEVLRRSDPAGYEDRPAPPPEALPMAPAERVAVYSRRIKAGLAVFSPCDTVDVPARLARPVASPEEAEAVGREATLAEARRRGASRGMTFHSCGGADA